MSVSPTDRTPTPVTLEYVAPDEKNTKATIHIESRSRRGIAVKDVTVKTPGGWAIHDVWMAGTLEQHMDAVNCDSPYGPWHVVASGDLAAAGWSSFNAFYDINANPDTGTGTVSGEEHSVTTNGETYDGSSTGTAQVTESDEGYLIKLDMDYEVIWDTPDDLEDILGTDVLSGHVSRELKVISATEEECP